MTLQGQILSATLTTPDLDLALLDYRDVLGMELIQKGRLASDLAASWGRAAMTGRSYATLRPASGADCVMRIVEQPVPAGYRPTTTFGWNAFELTVQQVFEWPMKLEGSGFEVVGSPKEIEGLPYFVAMQVVGRGAEMLYLNEVRSDTPTSDLPRAQSATDRVFIVILGAPDLDAALEWYRTRLGLDEGSRYEIIYSMINRAFQLPADTKHRLAMAQNGRLPIAEIDAYPAVAKTRPAIPGLLPPGNALVSLAMRSLDDFDGELLAVPVSILEPPYDGARAATCVGPAGELVELIERAT